MTDPAPAPGQDAAYVADAVAVAYVYGRDVSYSWHHSMIEMLGYDLAHHGRVIRGGYVAMHCGTDGLVQARNRGVRVFLEERSAAWMLWLDTDMGFPPDVVDALLAVADPQARPVVGALCFAQRETGPDGLGGWLVQPQPTIFDWASYETPNGIQQGFLPRLDYSRDTVTQVAGTGSACILIHRSAFERVQKKNGAAWYDRIPNPYVGEMTSEDLSFCMRLRDVNIPIFVHTGVKTAHAKSIWIDERVYDRMPPPPAPPQPDGITLWPLGGLRRSASPPAPPAAGEAEPAGTAAGEAEPAGTAAADA